MVLEGRKVKMVAANSGEDAQMARDQTVDYDSVTPQTLDRIRELLRNRVLWPSTNQAGRMSSSDAMQAALLFNVRHAIDGITEVDVLKALDVAEEDRPCLQNLSAILCVLLRYGKGGGKVNPADCLPMIQQMIKEDAQLLDDVLNHNPSKVLRPLMEKVLDLYSSDRLGMVPCRLLPIGKLWAALATWVKATTTYILFLNPKWKMQEPKCRQLPTPRTPPSHIIEDEQLYPAVDIVVKTTPAPGLRPLYKSDLTLNCSFSSSNGLPNVPSRSSPSSGSRPYSPTSCGLPAIGSPFSVSTRSGASSPPATLTFEPSSLSLTVDEIKEQFDFFDVEGKGWVQKEEFLELYETMDLLGREEPAKMAQLLQKFGTADGRLNFTEFCILMLKVTQR